MLTAIDTDTTSSSAVKGGLKRLRQATGQLVGSVFYGTLLKAQRNSELKGRYGHGGRGEEAFGAQLDAIMAERMGTATKGGLEKALFDRLKHQQEMISKLNHIPEEEKK